MTASYDVNNHQTGVTVDANGNPSSIPVPIAYSVFATWDVENRLMAVGHQVSPPANYSYDPANHRVWRGNISGIPPDITHGPLDEVTFWSISGSRWHFAAGFCPAERPLTRLPVHRVASNP